MLLSDEMGYFRKKYSIENISCSTCFKCRQQMWFALAHRNICITDIQLRPHLNTLSKILGLLKLMGILPLISVGLWFPSPVMKMCGKGGILEEHTGSYGENEECHSRSPVMQFSGEQWPWRKRKGSTAERALCREVGGDFTKGCGRVLQVCQVAWLNV